MTDEYVKYLDDLETLENQIKRQCEENIRLLHEHREKMAKMREALKNGDKDELVRLSKDLLGCL